MPGGVSPLALPNAPCPLPGTRQGRNVLNSGKRLPGLAATKSKGGAGSQAAPCTREGEKEL